MAGFRSARAQLDAAKDRANLTAADQRLDKRLGLTVAPSPVHIALVNVMGDLMSMGIKLSANNGTPTHLRVLMRTLDQMRPMLLENVSSMPPDRIKLFMGDLVARMQSIIDTPDVTDVSTLPVEPEAPHGQSEPVEQGAGVADGHVAEGT